MTAATLPPRAPAHAQAGRAGGLGPHPLAGTGTMIRLALRRERIPLLAWIIVVVATAASTVATIAKLYPDEAGRRALATGIAANPAFLVITGPLSDSSVGGRLGLADRRDRRHSRRVDGAVHGDPADEGGRGGRPHRTHRCRGARTGSAADRRGRGGRVGQSAHRAVGHGGLGGAGPGRGRLARVRSGVGRTGPGVHRRGRPGRAADRECQGGQRHRRHRAGRGVRSAGDRRCRRGGRAGLALAARLGRARWGRSAAIVGGCCCCSSHSPRCACMPRCSCSDAGSRPGDLARPPRTGRECPPEHPRGTGRASAPRIVRRLAGRVRGLRSGDRDDRRQRRHVARRQPADGRIPRETRWHVGHRGRRDRRRRRNRRAPRGGLRGHRGAADVQRGERGPGGAAAGHCGRAGPLDGRDISPSPSPDPPSCCSSAG